MGAVSEHESGAPNSALRQLASDLLIVLAERRRTDFLIEAGRRLSASLNMRRCARTAIELATPFLADAAMVVLPPSGRRHAGWLRLTSTDRALQAGEHRPQPYQPPVRPTSERSDDTVDPVHYSQVYERELKKAGGDVTLIVYETGGHAFGKVRNDDPHT